MKIFHLLYLVSAVTAAPGCPMAHLHKRQSLPLSANEGNSGPTNSLVFNAQEQLVNVQPGSGHEYQAPTSSDKRGLCPGLNAAANHGFLPRNGITTIQQTIDGLGAAYGLGAEFAAALSVIAIALTGDPTSGTWSIGGGYSPGLLGGLLLSNPSGISFSHNLFESDASPTRSDAYLNNGDAVKLILSKFDSLYRKANDKGEFTLDIIRNHNKEVHDFSVNNNPYFFSAPFAGLVPPIAHHLIINLMSNHSAENKNGFLTKDVLKSFFAISGPEGAHVYNEGTERIPPNWYRRPTSNPYGVVAAVADVAILATKYPDILRVGGNTGTTNSFAGVNIGDLTGGVYNAQTLLQGNNLGCFAFQTVQQGIPSVLSGVVSTLAPVISLVNQFVSPVLQTLNCPALTSFNQSLLNQNQFPGAGYRPTA